MNRITFLFVFFASHCVVNGQQSSCRSADGGRGRCITIYNCAPLLAIVNKPNRTPQDLDYLRRSQCGFDGNSPNVCCPEKTGQQPTTNQCFTPDGSPGQCVGLYSCQSLANFLQEPLSNEVIQYLRKAKCDGPEKFNVCCAPFATPNKVQKVNCKATVSALLPNPNSECCGTDAVVGDKIIGGKATFVDQYPWMILIEHKTNSGTETPCGGALISGKYVLTAAHCVVGRLTTISRPTHIRLGEYDTRKDGPDCMRVAGGGQDCTEGTLSIPIERIIPHPEYDPRSSNKRNDIALIRMRQTVPYTDFIRPICLPTVDVTLKTDNFKTIAAGWGVDDSGQNSPVKLDVELPYVNNDACAPNTTVGSLWKGQLCAGGLQGKDSCRGDSGGPLMYENIKRYEVIGVVSFGANPCGSEGIPAVYTNVYEYISWIKSNISP